MEEIDNTRNKQWKRRRRSVRALESETGARSILVSPCCRCWSLRWMSWTTRAGGNRRVREVDVVKSRRVQFNLVKIESSWRTESVILRWIAYCSRGKDDIFKK